MLAAMLEWVQNPDNASTIQAIAAIVQAFASLVQIGLTVALVGATIWYAHLTRVITRQSERHERNQWRPVIAMQASSVVSAESSGIAHIKITMKLRSVGVGPAIQFRTGVLQTSGAPADVETVYERAFVEPTALPSGDSTERHYAVFTSERVVFRFFALYSDITGLEHSSAMDLEFTQRGVDPTASSTWRTRYGPLSLDSSDIPS